MKLSELGEFKFIERIAPLFRSNFPDGVEGIGNDCAVIPFQNDLSYLITTDLLNENVHFIKNKISPEDLGYKSLAVNLSDIAAMGGKPLYAFLSIGLPSETSVEWADRFFLGFHDLAKSTNVFLLGGDTTRSPFMTINVLIIGMIETKNIKRRSQAKIGDIICSTGYVGNSGAGLKILLEDLENDRVTSLLLKDHLRPRPHLEEGQWLSKQGGVHAMMDISDGIASDLLRIMEESSCGAHLEVEKIPLTIELKEICKRYNWNAETLGLSAGEDYCLLLAIDPNEFALIQKGFHQKFHRPLFHFGRITSSTNLECSFHGSPYELKKSGFDNFL